MQSFRFGLSNTIIYLLLAIAGIRLIALCFFGLMPQDAYYDFYAQHLALSYFDHPPMIAYLLRTATALFGKKVFVLKMADTLVSLAMLAAFFTLAKQFVGNKKAWIATALMASTFMLSILSLISTPDVPLMLCWTLSLLFLQRAVLRQQKIYWIWAGVMSGLSFDSKYTAVFIVIGLIGFLLISKPYRRWLISPWFFAYLLLFALVSLPVVIWNVNNGFASFKFQSAGRVNEGLQIDPLGFLGVIGHQAAILLPILFASLIYFLFRLVKKFGVRLDKMPTDSLFLWCFFLPIFLGFFFISFFYWVKLNWMMPAYISGIIWVCRYWNGKWLRYQLIVSLVVHVLLLVEILFYPVPIQSDDTWYGWAPLAKQVSDIRKDYPAAFIFSADDYKTASVLNFYLPEMIYSRNIVGERALQYDFIGSDLQQLGGKDALLIDSNPRFSDQPDSNSRIPVSYNRYFDRFIPLKPILISGNGKLQRRFSVFLCKNYHPIVK